MGLSNGRGYLMEWSPSSSSESGLGKKRTREEATEHIETTEKRGCDEPMSWWTCLMLGISSNKSRIIKRSSSSN